MLRIFLFIFNLRLFFKSALIRINFKLVMNLNTISLFTAKFIFLKEKKNKERQVHKFKKLNQTTTKRKKVLEKIATKLKSKWYYWHYLSKLILNFRYVIRIYRWFNLIKMNRKMEEMRLWKNYKRFNIETQLKTLKLNLNSLTFGAFEYNCKHTLNCNKKSLKISTHTHKRAEQFIFKST